MSKKLSDLKKGEDKKIDLRGEKKINKIPKKLFKKEKKSKLSDISISREDHFWVKGTTFKSHPFLFSAFKIFLVGVLILASINFINIIHKAISLREELVLEGKEKLESIVSSNLEREVTFNEVQLELEQIEKDFKMLMISLPLSSELGKSPSVALSSGLESLKLISEALSDIDNIKTNLDIVLESFLEGESSGDIAVNIENLKVYANSGLDKSIKALEKIEEIDFSSIPKISASLEGLSENINAAIITLKKVQDHLPEILKLIGAEGKHRYLVLLQNNNEIRATGGFIGSYLIVETENAKISKLETHDVYQLDDPFNGYIEPPEDFKSFTDNIRFRDSNFYVDFPETAEFASKVYQLQGGEKVDTVVAINQSLLEDFLKITGPISVPDFATLNHENYTLFLSYIIESKFSGWSDPKLILKEFVPEFEKRIFKKENFNEIARLLVKGIQQKDIQIYSKDPEIEKFISDISADGAIKNYSHDYLAIFHTSIGGNKSDQFLQDKIVHHTNIKKNGQIVNTLKIRRKHNWSDEILNKWNGLLKEQGFQEIDENLLFILGKGRNVSLMRIYLPQGSNIISSNLQGEVKLDEKLGRTYILSTIEVPLFEERNFEIVYTIPELEENAAYTFLAQKQSGSVPSLLTKTLEWEGKDPISVIPSSAKIEVNNSVSYATTLLYDRFFAVLGY